MAQQNEHLQCMEKLCHSCLAFNDKVIQSASHCISGSYLRRKQAPPLLLVHVAYGLNKCLVSTGKVSSANYVTLNLSTISKCKLCNDDLDMLACSICLFYKLPKSLVILVWEDFWGI